MQRLGTARARHCTRSAWHTLGMARHAARRAQDSTPARHTARHATLGTVGTLERPRGTGAARHARHGTLGTAWSVGTTRHAWPIGTLCHRTQQRDVSVWWRGGKGGQAGAPLNEENALRSLDDGHANWAFRRLRGRHVGQDFCRQKARVMDAGVAISCTHEAHTSARESDLGPGRAEGGSPTCPQGRKQ